LKAGVYGNGELKVTLHSDLKIVKGIADKEIKLTGRFKWSQEKIDGEVADGAIIFIKSTATLRPTLKRTNGQQNIKPPISLLSKYLNGIPTNTDASNEMKEIFDGISPFDNPKPTDLIKYLIEAKTFENKSATILDFFAGSGTTGHAVLKLNAQDGGKRQFILCSTNDEKEPIVDKVLYPRIKKVIDGYADNAPIPANLRYFKTDFVEKKGGTSQLKIDLTRQCADMLCVKENVFEVVKTKKSAKNYKFFKNGKKYLGVFFDFFTDPEFTDFIKELNALPRETEKAVYVFVLDGSAGIFSDEFAGVANCEVKEIPQKILDIYKQLAREVARK
jgi:adenine-specific DNA-methyltransferase